MSFPEITLDPKVSADHTEAVRQYISKFQEGGPPPILSIEHFSVMVGLLPEAVFGMTNSPASYYRTFRVRKSNGGTRRIDAPLPTLLQVQRWILENILETKECHSAAKAYIKKRSIKSNARLHRAQPFILKTDIKNFFGSINEFEVTKIFIGFGYREKVAIGLAKVCCLNGVLPQGAATSGYISNLLLYNFDVEMLDFCQKLQLRYSRYADDVTVSGPDLDRGIVMPKIATLLKSKSLKINKKKTKLVRRNNQQKITGIVVNERLSVERTYLKSIRQECYYIDKFGIYGHARHIGSKSPKGTLERVLGRVSHALFVRSDDKVLKQMKRALLVERKNVFGY